MVSGASGRRRVRRLRLACSKRTEETKGAYRMGRLGPLSPLGPYTFLAKLCERHLYPFLIAFAPMSKNLVLCMDGTRNEFGDRPTNVVRLFQCLQSKETEQVIYYNPGVGTMGEPGMISKIGKAFTKALGAGFGLGITADVLDATLFLMRSWEEGDRIYIFGFSRGAFTARIIAAFISRCGLLRAHQENLLPYALRLYRKAYRSAQAAILEEFKSTFSREVDTHFLGVWDTVSSVGTVWAPVGWPNTARNPDVKIVRHAIAIEERRAFYRSNRMYALEEQDLLQYWFPGVHSDVGGGYLETDNTLWSPPLCWIADEAVKAGLKIEATELEALRKPPMGNPHQSLAGMWHLLEYFPKKRWNSETEKHQLHFNRGKPRMIRPGECLHDSVKALFEANKHWQPDSLTNAGVTRDTIDSLETTEAGAYIVPGESD